MEQTTIFLLIALCLIIMSSSSSIVYWYTKSDTTTLDPTQAPNNSSSTQAPISSNSNFKKFLENNLSKTNQENMTTDNFNKIKKIFDDSLNAFPSDIKQNLKCQDITKDNIRIVFMCLLSQTDPVNMDKDSFAIIFITLILIEEMLKNPNIEAIDVIEYNKKTETINIKVPNELSSMFLPVQVKINDKNIQLPVKDVKESYLTLETYQSIKLDNQPIINPESLEVVEEVTLDVTYNGITKPVKFLVNSKLDIIGSMENDLSIPLNKIDAHNVTIDTILLLITVFKRPVEPKRECLCIG